MVAIACLLLAAVAQTPVVDVVAPVDPAIIVTLTPRVLLTNNTDRPIVAIAVIWQREGGHRTTQVYESTTKTPVVSPRGQIILTPDGFYQSVGVRPASSHRELDEAYHVTINVDAVIFDDGLILGPDKSGLVDGLSGRRQAIDRIMQTVQKAKAEGQDVDAALQALMPTGMNFAAPPDGATNFLKFYIGELLHQRVSNLPPRDRDVILSGLEQIPQLPTFYRR
jgi:hypothetical protein